MLFVPTQQLVMLTNLLLRFPYWKKVANFDLGNIINDELDTSVSDTAYKRKPRRIEETRLMPSDHQWSNQQTPS
jgi:hypothetical protein